MAAPSFQDASGSVALTARPSSAASSFSTTWSIVKLAAFCRGGNSLNVSRNCATTAVAGQRDVGVVEEPVVVGVRGHVGALERVGAQVEQLRDAQRHERLRPDPQRPLRPLLHEDDLPVVEPEREHVAVVGEVDACPAAGSCRPRRSGTAAGCSRRCAPCRSCRRSAWPAFSFSTMSGSPAAARNVGSQSWCWTISFETDAGRDLPGPADQLRDAEGAFPVRVLLAAERRHAAVRPRVHVRPVVGRVDRRSCCRRSRARRACRGRAPTSLSWSIIVSW